MYVVCGFSQTKRKHSRLMWFGWSLGSIIIFHIEIQGKGPGENGANVLTYMLLY